VLFAVSIGVLSYWYCPCCHDACKKNPRVYAEFPNAKEKWVNFKPFTASTLNFMHPTITIVLLTTFVISHSLSPTFELIAIYHRPISEEDYICTKLTQDFPLSFLKIHLRLHWRFMFLLTPIFLPPSHTQTHCSMLINVLLLVIYVLFTLSFLSFFPGAIFYSKLLVNCSDEEADDEY
jgi:hypothetical protein